MTDFPSYIQRIVYSITGFKLVIMVLIYCEYALCKIRYLHSVRSSVRRTVTDITVHGTVSRLSDVLLWSKVHFKSTCYIMTSLGTRHFSMENHYKLSQKNLQCVNQTSKLLS